MAKDKKTRKQQAAKGSSRLKDLAANPVVTDLAAAALISAAAALKNPPKAPAGAPGAQNDLAALARDGARRGASLWQLAVDFGRQALDTLVGDQKPVKRSAKGAKSAAKTARKSAKPAAKTARKSAKPAAKSARKSTKIAAKAVRKSAPRGKPRAK